jgi:hypothetical protein
LNANALLAELEERSVILLTVGDNLLVDAPRGALTSELRSAIYANKASLLRELRERPQLAQPARANSSRLVEYAASVLPKIRLTIRETGDTKRDFDLVGRVRRAIQEFQPGGNHIYLTIITLDERRFMVEWRALADRELRTALAHILARASEAGDSETAHTTRES